MTEQTLDRRSPRGGEHPWHGIVWIVLAGTILGLGYNWLGLESRRPWGLTWIAEDKVEALGDTVVELQGNMGAGAPVSDDPLAIPAPTAGLPPIPDVGRPVQIELGAVKAYFDADAALLIDAREPEEYAESHIPGSINLPYNTVVTDPARLEALDPGGRPIITYCGGGTCELSISLAEELYFTGFSRVAVYMGGFPAWVEAGYPIDKATQ
jgi:rhodanese-related sulfurtransferase